jgi:hypothetical protein
MTSLKIYCPKSSRNPNSRGRGKKYWRRWPVLRVRGRFVGVTLYIAKFGNLLPLTFLIYRGSVKRSSSLKNKNRIYSSK